MHQTNGDETVNRFEGVDGVATGNWNTRLGTDRLAPFENAFDRIERQFVDRHADDGQRQQRHATHGIDVGEGVGRCDAAEIEGVIDDWHEEIGGRHQRLIGVELVDGCVIAGLDADQQLLGHDGGNGLGEDLFEYIRSDLASAAAAVCKLGQFERLGVDAFRSCGRVGPGFFFGHDSPLGVGGVKVVVWPGSLSARLFSCFQSPPHRSPP
jgi:hypothetical protein